MRQQIYSFVEILPDGLLHQPEQQCETQAIIINFKPVPVELLQTTSSTMSGAKAQVQVPNLILLFIQPFTFSLPIQNCITISLNDYPSKFLKTSSDRMTGCLEFGISFSINKFLTQKM